MSKKQFIELAEAIRSNGSFTQAQIELLADFCHRQNPRFKRDRWLSFIKRECGANGTMLPASVTSPKKLMEWAIQSEVVA